MTLARHPGVDVAAIEDANGQRAPIPITAARRAQLRGAAAFVPAGLRRLESIDALKPDPRIAIGDGVAIHDARAAGERLGGAGRPRASAKP